MNEGLIYRFKVFYKNETSEIFGGKALKPEYLYSDFDGLMDWDEYYNLSSMNLSTKDVLKMLQKFIKEYYKILIN